MAAIDVILRQINEIAEREGRIPRNLETTQWLFGQLRSEMGAGDTPWVEIYVRKVRIDVFPR